jgi:hypothetical protein
MSTVNDNGNNNKHIEIVCEYEVTDAEWATINAYLNMKFQEFALGKYGNVKACLVDDDN